MKSAHLLRPRIKSNLHLLLIKVTVHKKHKLTKILKYNTSHTSSLCSQAHARITPKPTMPQQHVSSHRKSFTRIQGEGDCEALLQAHLKGWPQNSWGWSFSENKTKQAGWTSSGRGRCRHQEASVAIPRQSQHQRGGGQAHMLGSGGGDGGGRLCDRVKSITHTAALGPCHTLCNIKAVRQAPQVRVKPLFPLGYHQ